MNRLGARILIEDADAPRLEPAMPAAEPLLDPPPRVGGAALALAGVAVLAVGLAGLQTGNFVASQFDRAPWLGWSTLAIAVAGFGLLFASVGRELRGLFALVRVDRLRVELASGDARRIHAAARRWATDLPDAASLIPAIDAANDPDAIIGLLRVGPVATMRTRSDALGRTAAFQTAAGIGGHAFPVARRIADRLARVAPGAPGCRPPRHAPRPVRHPRPLAPHDARRGAGRRVGSRRKRRHPRAALQPVARPPAGRHGRRRSRRPADGPAGPRNSPQPAAQFPSSRAHRTPRRHCVTASRSIHLPTIAILIALGPAGSRPAGRLRSHAAAAPCAAEVAADARVFSRHLDRLDLACRAFAGRPKARAFPQRLRPASRWCCSSRSGRSA